MLLFYILYNSPHGILPHFNLHFYFLIKIVYIESILFFIKKTEEHSIILEIAFNRRNP